MSEKYWNGDKVCELIGISKPTLRRYVRKGALRALKLSPRVVRFDPADVEAFLQRGRSAGIEQAVCA